MHVAARVHGLEGRERREPEPGGLLDAAAQGAPRGGRRAWARRCARSRRTASRPPAPPTRARPARGGADGRERLDLTPEALGGAAAIGARELDGHARAAASARLSKTRPKPPCPSVLRVQ